MPKRVIDFDAMWASDKLASCAEWAQVEYAWLYGLADASGSFEMTNLRVIWGRVAAIRRNFTLERLEQVLQEFIARGLLFTWQENGKRYGHWTWSDVPGRLPPPSWRARLERLSPPVPRGEMAAYLSQFGGSSHRRSAPEAESAAERPPAASATDSSAKEVTVQSNQEPAGGSLNGGLEAPQAQDLDLDLDLNLDSDLEKGRKEAAAGASLSRHSDLSNTQIEAGCTPERLLEIYEAERGGLPPAGRLTPERLRKCALLLAAGIAPHQFREAVGRAAVTPFLAGGGLRGWRASFDWFLADHANVRKVLAGHYGAVSARGPGSADARRSFATNTAQCARRAQA
jgi:hypothetical protein